MEVDHVPYIFGSFSRRRHSQNLSAAKKSAVEVSSKAPCHMHSHSQPHVVTRPKEQEIATQRTKSCYQKVSADEDKRYICSYCNGLLIEPRVLSCLHTFCTKCLQEIERTDIWNTGSVVSLNGKSENANSGGSGSDTSEYRRGSSPNCNHNSEKTNEAECAIACPLCGVRTPLNRQGVLGLAPNYVLQHRIVLATLSSENTKLLCDLCTSDVTATHRCSECLVNLCEVCMENHRKHRVASRHELVALKDARQKGLMRIHRQIMCQCHPEQELIAYCSTCLQVVCKECMRSSHCSHDCEPASRAALSRTAHVQHTLQKTRTIVDKASALSRRLQITHGSVESQCRRIEEEIEKFVEAYRETLEEHRKELLKKVNEVRQEKLNLITTRHQELEKKMQDAQYTVQFAEELLSEGSDVEILTFICTILRKLEFYNKINTEDHIVPKVSSSVHFLPNETIEYPNGVVPLYGAISTQTVSPEQCILHKEGLENLRVHRRAEITLETRDCAGNQVTYGGEVVTAELWYRDAGTSCRSLAVHVTDNRNGTYAISFTPDTPGKLSLLVNVKGQHIKDSPFPILVRNLRPHRGTYHCCNFCSSGGNKEATCACGGTMPGGYKGCGHGHEGHPGRRHWSCCGNILENSECGRINSIMYQFTL